MTLTTLPRDTSTSDVIAELKQSGACIVANRLDDDRVDRLIAETADLIEHSASGDDDFVGRRTKRTGALVAHSAACRETVVDPLVLDVGRTFLADYCRKIQMMLTQTIAIFPGQGSQPLHRDRLAWGGYIPATIEPQVNTIWALTDFTEENGATRVIPGSNRWPADQRAERDEIVQAVMPRGSVLIYTGSVLHSGGENRSNDVRIGLNVDYCLDWLRQEENQYLSCPPEIARSLPQEVTDLIGYSTGGTVLGYWSDPTTTEGNQSTLAAEDAAGKRPLRHGPIEAS